MMFNSDENKLSMILIFSTVKTKSRPLNVKTLSGVAPVVITIPLSFNLSWTNPWMNYSVLELYMKPFILFETPLEDK